MRIYLVEPDAAGRVSGGYLYNQRLTTAGDAISAVSAVAGSLGTALTAIALGPADWLILDSLFLEPVAFAAFDEVRRETGCRLGLMLHAFPSFVERADRGDKAGLIDPRPSDSELALLAQLDVVVCPGPYGPRVLRQSGITTATVSCPPGRVPIVTLPNTRRPASRSAPIQVLTVGNVTRGKGYQDALEALAACHDLEWHWRIIGSLAWDPGYVAELEQRVLGAGLSQRIEFLGQLSPEATAQHYQGSDLFLLASVTENHPLVLLEARAYGLPVVGYRVGGVPDLVGDAGLLASPFDIEELGSLLRRALSDAPLRRRLSGLALRASDTPFEWSESALRLYEQLRNTPDRRVSP